WHLLTTGTPLSARLVPYHGYLSAQLPCAHAREDYFAAVPADEHHLDLAPGNDVQRVAGIVLEEDHRVAGIGALACDVDHPLEVGGGELAEERHFLQDGGCRHARPPPRAGGV